MQKHTPPTFKATSFFCPHCGVFAEQTWSESINCNYRNKLPNGGQQVTSFSLTDSAIAMCKHCFKYSLWINGVMKFPTNGNVEHANPDLPEDILNDYNEARNIVLQSPRGAAALLRLAIQKLCIHLGEKGKNINDDIESLVKKGLPKSLQQALDSVRVVGNNAVHPGKIDLNDRPEIANSLFGFVNIICELLISQPKKIAEYYEANIPEGVRNKIDERDGAV